MCGNEYLTHQLQGGKRARGQPYNLFRKTRSLLGNCEDKKALPTGNKSIHINRQREMINNNNYFISTGEKTKVLEMEIKLARNKTPEAYNLSRRVHKEKEGQYEEARKVESQVKIAVMAGKGSPVELLPAMQLFRNRRGDTCSGTAKKGCLCVEQAAAKSLSKWHSCQPATGAGIYATTGMETDHAGSGSHPLLKHSCSRHTYFPQQTHTHSSPPFRITQPEGLC